MATATLKSHAESTTDASSYSFATQETGAAAVPRFVFVWGRKNSANSGIPATCTIGGEALTRRVFLENNIGTANPKMVTAWFSGTPSVGGSQTVAVTFTEDGIEGGTAATMIRSGVAVYEGAALDVVPFDTETNGATGTNDRVTTVSIDYAQGGVVIGGGAMSTGAAETAAWTGGITTTDFEQSVESNNSHVSCSHTDDLTAATGQAVTLTWTSNAGSDDNSMSVISLQIANVALTATGIAAGTPSVGAPTIAQDDLVSFFEDTGAPAGQEKRNRRRREYEDQLERDIAISAGRAEESAPPVPPAPVALEPFEPAVEPSEPAEDRAPLIRADIQRVSRKRAEAIHAAEQKALMEAMEKAQRRADEEDEDDVEAVLMAVI